jgi:co-chaperonin GroES (HSP10)
MNTLTAIGSNVAIRMNDRVLESAGGIAIPVTVAKPEKEGVVASIGNRVEDVKVGDTVGFPGHLGTRMEVGGEDWLVIDASKLLYVREWPGQE